MLATIATIVAINLSLGIISSNMGIESMKVSMYKEGRTLKDGKLVNSYQGNDYSWADGSMQQENGMTGWDMKAGNRNYISQKDAFSHGWYMKDGNRKYTSQKEVFPHEISQKEAFFTWMVHEGW